MEYQSEELHLPIVCMTSLIYWTSFAIHLTREQYFHVASIMYGCCIFFIKLAILLQILEVFVPLKSNNYFFWSCHALIWINFVFYTISFFLEIFSCRPMDKVWNILITEGTCLDTTKLNIAASSINAASDVVILVLPQLRIWGLHMPLHKKIAVSAVFFVGILYVPF